jgi:hypothetical protein
MACCKCCCPEGEECCKAQGASGICCPPERCCGTPANPFCCPSNQVCCNGIRCCQPTDICVNGVCCNCGISCGPVFAVFGQEAIRLNFFGCRTLCSSSTTQTIDNIEYTITSNRSVNIAGSNCVIQDGKVIESISLQIRWTSSISSRTVSPNLPTGRSCFAGCGKFYVYELEKCTSQGLCGSGDFEEASSGDVSVSNVGPFGCPSTTCNCDDDLEECCKYQTPNFLAGQPCEEPVDCATDCKDLSGPSYVGRNPLP